MRRPLDQPNARQHDTSARMCACLRRTIGWCVHGDAHKLTGTQEGVWGTREAAKEQWGINERAREVGRYAGKRERERGGRRREGGRKGAREGRSHAHGGSPKRSSFCHSYLRSNRKQFIGMKTQREVHKSTNTNKITNTQTL